MASSQVEAAPSAPFGCVLRDHNRRDERRERGREINERASENFQKNLKILVKDHLQGCIAVPSENSENQEPPRSSLRLPSKPQNLGSPSALTTRQARVLDKWASQQARVIVSTVEHEAELISNSLSNPSEAAAPPPERENNIPEVSVGSAIASNLGAFSLVQIWEARLNRLPTLSRSSSGMSNVEESVADESPPLALERFESTVPGKDHKSILLVDVEPQKRTPPSPSPSPSIPVQIDQKLPPTLKNSDEGGKKERVRIVDIIKRLADHDPHESLAGKDRVQEQAERKLSFTQSRIIKGRQAFTDMLKQMEQCRTAELTALRERHAVSKFTHRGRIQSMIKLRLMNQLRLPPPPPPPGPQGSSIKHLRDRFNTCIELHKTAQSDIANSRTCGREIVNTSKSSSTNVPQLPLQDHSVSGTRAYAYEEPKLHSDESSKGKDQQPSIPDLHTSSESPKTRDCEEASVEEGSDVRPGLQETVMSSIHHSVVQCGLSLGISIPTLQEALDPTESINEWYDESEMTEEHEFDDDDNEQQQRATNYDWISVISRPRSYWEFLRQEWYEKMRTTRSQNDEISQLLARRRVSSCLDSRFREIMDRMLSSHVAIQTNEETLNDDPHQSTLTYLQRHANQHHQHEQLQDDEEEDCSSVTPHHQGNAYSDQLPSPSPSREWSYHDTDSDQVASHLPSPPPPFYQGSRRFSPRNTPSMEMEFMYGLRSHIEQIHQEISELRSEVRTCVEMQFKLQSSMKHEVYLGLEEGRRRSYDKAPRKGSCCICYEKRVDSFLYRCGHMCSCFNCAHELQCSGGKCPICLTPIDDVVRAYADW